VWPRTVTQAVFIALSRKARTLRMESSMPRGLLATTRYIALDALKAPVAQAAARTQGSRNGAPNPSASLRKPLGRDGPRTWTRRWPPQFAGSRAITLRYFEQMRPERSRRGDRRQQDAARQRDPPRYRTSAGVLLAKAAWMSSIGDRAGPSSSTRYTAPRRAGWVQPASAALSANPPRAAALAHRFLSMSKGKVLLMTLSKTNSLRPLPRSCFSPAARSWDNRSLKSDAPRTVRHRSRTANRQPRRGKLAGEIQ